MKKKLGKRAAASDDEDSPPPPKQALKLQTAKPLRKSEAATARIKPAPKASAQQNNKARPQSVDPRRRLPEATGKSRQKKRKPSPEEPVELEIDTTQVRRKFAEMESRQYGELTAELADYLSKKVAAGLREAVEGDAQEPVRPTAGAGRPRRTRASQLPSLPADLPGVQKLTRAEQAAIMQHFAMIQPSRPTPCFFHCCFKLAAGLSYLFSGLLLRSLVARFLLTFASLVLDFWVTKNLTGRMLVGLRWWSGDLRDGLGEDVYFESYDVPLNFNAFDKTVFWGGLIAASGFWLFVALGRLLSLDLLWGLLSFTGALLSWTNLRAYFQCHRFHRRKVAGRSREGPQGLFEKLALAVF